jgi:glycosyltransferase involved in cell wall biosynthesis
MRLSIVIPAYNEELRIGKTLDEYLKFFKNIRQLNMLNFEILVVMNACKDNTLDVVKRIRVKNKEINYLDYKEGGKGFAIIQGFKNALKRNNDIIGFIDADGATPPEAFYDLVKILIINQDSAGVIASRWKEESKIKTKQTKTRRFLSRGFNFLVRSMFLFPYSDTQCGAKVFRRMALEKTINQFGVTRWAFDVDLLYSMKKEGFKIKDVSTIWEDKENTKLNIIKVPFEMFSGILRLRLIHSPFKFVVDAYDSLPDIIKIHKKII